MQINISGRVVCSKGLAAVKAAEDCIGAFSLVFGQKRAVTHNDEAGALARPATIPRARVAETGPKGNSYHYHFISKRQ